MRKERAMCSNTMMCTVTGTSCQLFTFILIRFFLVKYSVIRGNAKHGCCQKTPGKSRKEGQGKHSALRNISDMEGRMRLPLGKATRWGNSNTSILLRPDSGVNRVTHIKKLREVPPPLLFLLHMLFFLEFLPNSLLVFSGFPSPKMDPLWARFSLAFLRVCNSRDMKSTWASGKIVLLDVTQTAVSSFFLQLTQPGFMMVPGIAPSTYDWMYSGLQWVL